MAKKKNARTLARKGSLLPILGLFLGAAVLIALGIGAWAMNGGPEEGPGTLGPQLAVDNEKVDLGRQPLNRLVEAKFTITNTGDRTLTLDTSTPVKVLEGC